MSNDLITDNERRLAEPGSTNGARMRRPRSAGAHLERSRRAIRSVDDSAPILRPFADAEEARSVACSCRTMLGRHIDPTDLADSLAVILAAKVLDEAIGDIEFEAIEGAPRVSASKFDRVVRAALDLLRDATDDVQWPEVEVPELVAHQVLRDLGPYSVLLTAEQPDGGDTLRALFVAAVGTDQSKAGPSVLDDPAVAASLWRLVPPSSVSPSIKAVASAAADVFLASGGDVVVDLRDGAWSPPPRRR
jgi:hypothetical protein